jgi:glucose/arabinose dehydrogenase
MASAGRHAARGLALTIAILFPVQAAAAGLRAGFTETTIASGLANPTAMAFAPDGRVFVCQQGGQLRVIKDNTLLPTPFLSVAVSSVGERGLLGVAIDPNFAVNQFVYIYYTATTPVLHNRVSRFTANGDVAAAGSEVTLLDLPALGATNHNGGAIHFGPDGLLYIGVGENAVGSNSQTLGNLLGKILRINADGSIPSSNPFFDQATGANRAIWALGLRNPFTFAIEPVSGRMMINDVGQDAWEEINEGLPGANYGWPATEGPTTDPRFVSPIHAYPHDDEVCAIAGGTFSPVLSSPYPDEYRGDYFFADLCGGWIRQYDFVSGIAATDFASGIVGPVDLTIGPEGSLYYLARGAGNTTGVLVRIDFAGPLRPIITRHPASVTVAVGQTATFQVTATGTPPLSYQWLRNGVDIPGATSATLTLTGTRDDNGAQIRCRVANDAGEALSNPATLRIIIGKPPVPTILTPSPGAQYVAGGAIAYSGSATDPEDGALPASSFTWEVVFHHNAKAEPLVARSGERRGAFSIPNEGETSINVWYRIHLTVTDSDGQLASTFRDVRPRVVRLTLDTSPGGLTLTLDGHPVTSPHAFNSVVGMRRSIGAVSTQTTNGSTYAFRSWSDGGAQSHSFATPVRPRRITAVFRRVVPATTPSIRRPPPPCPDASSGCASPPPADPARPPDGSRPAVPRAMRRVATEWRAEKYDTEAPRTARTTLHTEAPRTARTTPLTEASRTSRADTKARSGNLQPNLGVLESSVSLLQPSQPVRSRRHGLRGTHTA